MRLFVAIELDGAARRAIADLQHELVDTFGGGQKGRLKWVGPEQLHLTLAFLGEVSDEREPEITGALGQPYPIRPFTLAFQALGMFPPSGMPRVLWLGTSEGTGEAVAAQAQVAARLAPLGFPSETRPFRPHLTLARWHQAASGVRRRLAGIDDRREIARTRVDGIVLLRSVLSSGGSRYTTLARGRFAGE